MTSNKRMLNVNRLIIYAIGCVGLFFDSTLAMFISMTLWVWLPDAICGEKLFLRLFNHNKN